MTTHEVARLAELCEAAADAMAQRDAEFCGSAPEREAVAAELAEFRALAQRAVAALRMLAPDRFPPPSALSDRAKEEIAAAARAIAGLADGDFLNVTGSDGATVALPVRRVSNHPFLTSRLFAVDRRTGEILELDVPG